MNKKNFIDLIVIILILLDTILLLITIFYALNTETTNYISLFDLIVCSILFVEYILNLKKNKDYKNFIKSNWIDLIAMLPDIIEHNIHISWFE
jgi:voltage-gated potassium channel